MRWPYPSFREGQRESIEAVREGLARGKIVALSAPTGFGKTAVVLYSILEFLEEGSGASSLYLVRTKNELEPVIRELYRLYEANSKPSYAFLLAKREMCYHALRESKKLSVPHDEFAETCRDLRERGLCPLRTLEFKPFSSTPEYLERAVAERACPWYASKYAMASVEVLAATYPYFFNPFIRQSVSSGGGNYAEMSRVVVVVDEAHNLDSVVQTADRRLSPKTVDAALRELEVYGSELDALDREALKEVLARLREFMRSYEGAPRYTAISIDEFREKVVGGVELERVEEGAESLRRLKVEARGIKARSFAKSVWRFIAYLEYAYSMLREDVGLFAIRGRLELKTLNPAVITGCLNEARSVVLMSGTLPSPEYLKSVYGLEREIECVEVRGVFPEEHKAYFCAVDVTTKYSERGEALYDKLARYISYIRFRVPPEYAILVVYPSYEIMEKVLFYYERERERLGLQTRDFVEGESTRITKVVEEVLETRTNVVIHAVAGGKLTEGVEITEDGRSLIGAVVIAGLPFPEPNDYTNACLERLAELYGKERAWEYVVLVPAVVKMKQAFGRALRSADDRACFFILDRRAMARKIVEKLSARLRIITLSKLAS